MDIGAVISKDNILGALPNGFYDLVYPNQELGLIESKYVDTLGTDVFHSNDAQVSHAATWAKKKEMVLGFQPPNGQLKMSWYLYNQDSGSYASSRIHVNGVAVTTDNQFRVGTTVTGATMTHTLTGINKGDTIAIWLSCDVGGGYVKDWRLIGTVSTTSFDTVNTV